MNRVRRHMQEDARTNTCTGTNVGLHALSLRQQFGADLLISIATFTAVGDGDIMKTDCHKKATVRQEEGDCDGGISQSATVLLSAA